MINVQLSAAEMQLVNNGAWILTKQGVIEKVYVLFGNLSEQMQRYLQENKRVLPQQALQLPPKISKGEQYKSLPYVVLDYPRLFSKEEVFAIRTFFWWGNYFSITLHLKGKLLEQYHGKLAAAAADNKLPGFYFSVEGNEFSFDLTGKNYFLRSNKKQLQLQGSFLKVSCKVGFERWDAAEQELLQAFERFINILSND